MHKDIYQGEMTNPINHETYLVTPELTDSYQAYWGPVSKFIQIEEPHRLTDFETISRIIHNIIDE